MRKDIIINRCTAYSSTAHIYAALRVDDRRVLATNIEDRSTREIPDDMKGGIVVFAQKEGISQLSAEKLADWIKNKTLQEDGFVGWSVGKFFPGRYFCKNGKVYSDENYSVEIIGISDDALIEIGEDLCRAFNQDSVLIKLYSDSNRFISYETA